MPIKSSEILTRHENIEVNKITYIGNSGDSPVVEGVMAKPVTAKEKSHPLVIYNTPGTKLSGTGYATTDSTIYGNIIPYVSNIGTGGSIVVSSSLREKDEYGGADIQDVLDIMEIGKQQPEWDGKNIIMIGFSRGAMMTYLAIKAGAKLTGAIIAAGETDLYAGEIERCNIDNNEDIRKQNDKMIPGLEGLEEEDRMEFLKSRSAIYWPEKLIDTPMLILHGEEDKAVASHHSKDIGAALTKAGGAKHDVKIIPEVGHGVLMAQDSTGKYFVEEMVINWCNNIIGCSKNKSTVLGAIEPSANIQNSSVEQAISESQSKNPD